MLLANKEMKRKGFFHNCSSIYLQCMSVGTCRQNFMEIWGAYKYVIVPLIHEGVIAVQEVQCAKYGD